MQFYLSILPVIAYGFFGLGDSQTKLRSNEDWRPLRDAFLNGTIEFGFELQRIQMAFSELNLPPL